jgi:short-subunit dehydrogenase
MPDVTDVHPAGSPTGRPLALVTGASSGIGLALATEFARRGYDLVVAAEDDRLHDAAATLRAAGASVQEVQVDLAEPAGVEELYARVRELSRPVDVVALNAGVGVSGGFLGSETGLEEQLRLVRLNVESTVHLAKLVGGDMLARDAGRMPFTSSIASEMPNPYQAVYGASKSFIQSLALAVRQEVGGSGVTVTAFMPGPTDTEFFGRAGMFDTLMGRGPKDDPAQVAAQAVDALLAGRPKVVTGSLMTKAQGLTLKVTPDLVKGAMEKALARPREALRR